MFRVSEELVPGLEIALADAGLRPREQWQVRKWLRFYLDFCASTRRAPSDPDHLLPFLDKLACDNRPARQCVQAGQAVRWYLCRSRAGHAAEAAAQAETRACWAAPLDALRAAIRLRNYSPRTLEAYTHWVHKFRIHVCGKPPAMLGDDDAKEFLTWLAVERQVSASTQNQAFNALLFFYRHGLGRDVGRLEGIVRAKRRRHIPVVLSRAEIDRLLAELEPPFDLVVRLLYGCGLRVSEALGLRIQSFNLDVGILTVHDGKGQKDRSLPLPRVLLPCIREQFARVAALRREDLARDYAGVFLPHQLERKYPKAGREFGWQWFFPARRPSLLAVTGRYRRHHLLDSEVQKVVKRAADAAGIPKRVTPHTFRHSYASHLLQANVDIRTIQERLGHSDLKTTMVYTHTVPSRTLKDVGSPLDLHPEPA